MVAAADVYSLVVWDVAICVAAVAGATSATGTFRSNSYWSERGPVCGSCS